MRALTLDQPWATLVAIGAKKIETRGWWTYHRGLLAIHASRNFNVAHKNLIYVNKYFRKALSGIALSDFPRGCIIATCDLVECWEIKEGPLLIDDREKAFGDYTPGRYMWVLENVKKFDKPIPARGFTGLWEWTAGRKE